jgi:hypothetical protein
MLKFFSLETLKSLEMDEVLKKNRKKMMKNTTKMVFKKSLMIKKKKNSVYIWVQ